MTHDRDFKRLVRHRMRKTGESYVSARAQLRRAHVAGRRASDHPGAAMHPFEKFTDPAKRALTRAQFEAEVGNSHSIATTHLLLGLIQDKDTMAVGMVARLAPQVLLLLLHNKSRIREAIERQPAEARGQEFGELVPSEPVRQAIELAFAEAQLIGDGTVGTGHLLVGMLGVEASSGARVLAEFGVTLDGARGKLRELTEYGTVPESSTLGRKPPDRDFAQWMEAAQVLARSEGSASVRIDHLIRAAPRSRAATEMFGQLGIDVRDALAAVPPPPAQLAAVDASLVDLASLRRQGARVDDDERAARDEWDRIHREWIRSWASSRRAGPPA